MVKKPWQITPIHQVFANFHNFDNIPYANGLQFAKLPIVLIRQTFFTTKGFYYTVHSIAIHLI